MSGSSGGLYAAYGSNMDPEQMLERCPHSPAAGTGWLTGWRLTFGAEEHGWDGALPMIVPDAGDPGGDEPPGQVFVALYEVSTQDLAVLDSWEGADTGLYSRIKIRVSTLEGDVLASAYILDGYEGGLPSARMIGLMADAAEAAGAPDTYVADLRARPCRSLGE
ncbi:gamma-glutamylcyclotransferase family protein [uncultured Jatrophihabitans sp.]|uniref:gamma-glutamylcyclotransferase family protein n=1 Tax=uncultured Jatrophihabitans sp. TaxID=1610747 RepID=UPI0035CB7BC4